jgi:hypothetical protein
MNSCKVFKGYLRKSYSEEHVPGSMIHSIILVSGKYYLAENVKHHMLTDFSERKIFR